MVLNSYEAIYAALIKQSNDFAGRSNSFRLQVFLGRVKDIAFTTFSPKWVSTKKTTMQTLKVHDGYFISKTCVHPY